MALGCLLAWTALRRNDGSGLGVAYACAVGHPRRLDRVLTVLSPLGCLLAWTALRRNDGSGLGVAYALTRLDIPDAWTEF